ncbi:nuclear pore complex protein NUP98A-like [Scomber scombrus]|uniref:Nuclear pore complex protein NUP98A-like n=1 Tax=Scomber scombrus TaxID=13677 RepID=A0AAV1Q041_SCOSC
MMLGLSLRVSWICLLFSSGACFPAKGGGDYAPGSSNLQSEGSFHHLVYRQPSANPQQSPTGNQSPSSVAAGYAPSLPISYSSAGYFSPPVGTGSMHRQPAAGSSSVYGDTSDFAYSAGNAGNTFGNGGSSPGLLSGGAASDLNTWIEARPFIDLSFLESAQGMPESISGETSLPVPSSYIIQSRNGYLRDRQAFSHKTYDPEFPEAPVVMSAPASGSKGGKKV